MIKPTKISGLDSLLHISEKSSEEDRIRWLLQLFGWLRGSLSDRFGNDEALRQPIVKLKHFLAVLDRHPAEKASIARTLRSLFRDLSTMNYFVK